MPRLTVELEVTQDSLPGQVVPAQAVMIEVQTHEDEETAAPGDEIGCFSVYPFAGGPFRLRCPTADIDIRTGWITL